MTHLSLDQLLALREPGLEPGLTAARAHLDVCADCQAEARRLDQRSARLRALPSLRPARSRWNVVRQQMAAERRRRRIRWGAVATAAVAAGVLVAVAVRHAERRTDMAELAIDSVRARSSELERLLQSYDPEARLTDGATAIAAGQLEDQIARVDRQLELVQVTPQGLEERQLQLQLWRQRVGLLDALVDVHLTRASQVGF
jgi:hypothetical protein